MFDEAAGALVQRGKRVNAAGQTKREDIVAIENLPRFPVYQLVQPHDLGYDGIFERYAFGS